MLNLNPKHLKIIKKILSTHVHNQTVWAYGSRVKGTSHEGSDLDLVIIDTKENPTKQLSILKTAFSESNLPITVDILNWSDIPEQFKEEINRIHEVLQSAC